MSDHIILIGYMGCGKTTLGKKLSFRKKLALLDTDKMIEQKQRKTVSEIFDEDGEAAFRMMETECLKEIGSYSDRYIISSGGGLPLKEENRKLLKKLGCVFYLRARPDTIYGRLKNDTTRPLLREDNPEDKIREMIEARDPLYREAADIIVDVDEKSYETLIREILKGMKGKDK